MMSTAKRIGSVGVAVLAVMACALPAPVSTVSSAVRLSADSTALIMGATTGPTLSDADMKIIMRQVIAPTYPGQTIESVAVTTPEEFWPFTGVFRLVGFAGGDPRIFGPGGAAWPDEPWWKLSGLFDLSFDQSVQAGLADLEMAMASYGDDDLVIFGYSQGAAVAIREKQRLAMQYPIGTKAPDIDFVLGGDPNLPNGGLFARFPGIDIPILDFSLNGPEPTDTQFDTVVFTRQYDFFADFPLYPLNLVADLNALLGGVYVHTDPFNISLAPDLSTSPPIKTQYGDTTYYFFETQDLPLFAPLRALGVPEPVIDVVEPFFRALVELGYDRSIPPGEPTPARLIPTLNPAKVTADLVNAIDEGVTNALALAGSPAPVRSPVPATLAAPTTGTAKPDISPQVTPTDTPTPEPSTSASAPAVKPAKPRPVVRDSHRGEGDQPTTRTVAESSTDSSSRGASGGEHRSRKATRKAITKPKAGAGAPPAASSIDDSLDRHS